MHRVDARQHKLHTYACREPDAYTKQGSRLSLCFQLPHRPRGNQNFDTLCWKRRAGKPGSATGAHVHIYVHRRTDSGSAFEQVTANVKTWHWGGGKKIHWFLFLLHLSVERRGWSSSPTCTLCFIGWMNELMLRGGFSGVCLRLFYIFTSD